MVICTKSCQGHVFAFELQKREAMNVLWDCEVDVGSLKEML
jgi:hypothetical protein